MPRWRKWLLGSVAAVVLAALTVVFLEIRSISFDSARWKSADRGLFFSDRTRMVGDLTRNHLKPGMTREQVIALLGSPPLEFEFKDSTGWESNAPGAAPEDIVMSYIMADGISALGFSGLVLVLSPNKVLKSWHVWNSW